MAIINAPINGTEGTDVLTGDDNNDTINGLGGNDVLDGRGGDDTINGGAGADIITGGSGTDILTGGSGADIFRDTAADLNGDTIRDFQPGDRIQFTDLSIGTTTFGISESLFTYTSGSTTGSISIENLGPGRFVARAIATGGVEVRLQAAAHNDFNGDGYSDILWQKDDGTTTNWLGTNSGSAVDNSAHFYSNAGAGWHIVGTGDFNGDGRSDILWKKDDGTTTNWLGQEDGNIVDNSAHFAVNAGAGWSIVGIGDFNGDGRDDLMWQKTDGTTTNWLSRADGSMADNSPNFFANAGAGWAVAATGDFNGDGIDDILWRKTDGTITNWLGNANGGMSDNSANFFANAGAGWHIAGTGDFNGDGIDDILWRKDDGTTTNWLGNANGGMSDNSAHFWANPGAGWQVAEIGDFNGDAVDDILWRKTDGTTTNWLGHSDGNLVDNSAHLYANAGAGWHVIDPFGHDPFAVV